MPGTAPATIELRGISKAFGPVLANKDISISVQPGTTHGIIGENDAGKSPVMIIMVAMLIPAQLMASPPYILTVVILAGLVGKAIPPPARGVRPMSMNAEQSSLHKV